MRFLTPLLLLTLAACQTDQSGLPGATPEYQSVGEAVELNGAVPVAAVLAEPDAYVGERVTLEGEATEVCAMKGCWAVMRATLGDGTPGHIRLNVPRDASGAYLWTMPTDLAGERIVASGTLKRQTVSEADARHLAEESSGEPQAITGDIDELHLSLTGLQMADRPATATSERAATATSEHEPTS